MKHEEKIEMKSLAKLIAKLNEDGYTNNFAVKEGRLTNDTTSYSPEQVMIENFYRFEGESDPSDTSILYAIKTIDGKKGTLTDAYGVYADEGTSEFIKKVEDIKKETTPSAIKNADLF
jgi:hypothetical protein